MKECRVSITSTVDGQESSFVREGYIDLSPIHPKISYLEEDGQVQISLEGEKAYIERRGSYSLKLHLERGKVGKGYIGIGGQEGEIQTFAKKVAYSTSKNSLLVSLQYILTIGGEKQTTNIRLSAREKGENL